LEYDCVAFAFAPSGTQVLQVCSASETWETVLWQENDEALATENEKLDGGD